MVLPLIKKLLLDQEDKKHYRPVSNLPYVGKLVEKVAVKRFNGHVVDNELDEVLQSAYKEMHSIETALIKVYDDLLCAIDNRKCVLMALLDLSAAFDTVSHEIMLSRLEDSYGIKDEALKWVKSYFSDRYQFVSIEGAQSDKHKLPYGVPQGSILGPFSFPKYTSPLGGIAQKHNIMYHLYADDSQLYVVFDSGDGEDAALRLEACIEEMRLWMRDNMLKLNDNKTEFLLIQSKHNTKVPEVTSLHVGDADVKAVSCARNIGVMLDDKLTMVDHIKSVCKSSYFHLRNIAQARRYLTQEATSTLVHSFVTSKLDGLNALYYGLPDRVIHKLQLLQNHAAKLVVKKKKQDHVMPILHSLHWLPVQYRISFKILLLTYKCLHGKAPAYLSALLECYVPARSLRSSSQFLLKEKKAKLKTYGDRAFSVAAPRLWNKLPADVRGAKSIDSFKRSLKTHMFKLAFDV